MDLLPASTPEEVLNHIRALKRVQELVGTQGADDLVEAVTALQDQVKTLQDQQEALKEAGFEMPEYALHAIDSMEQQLDELYNEKEATEQTDAESNLQEDGDTFDQLQALLAREEKLQRQLGVSNPDDIIEMVAGLTDQLEDVYEDRDEDLNLDSIFTSTTSPPTAPSPDRGSDQTAVLEEELGVSDPNAVVAMMNDLTDQLEELYAGRQRLTEFNLNGADDAIEMVQNMQKQLEELYEKQEQMSDHGIEGIDHALAMIENMEAQLNELQDHPASEHEQSNIETATDRLDTLEQKLSSLSEEKERLRKKRDQLQERLDALTDELGTQDPNAIANLVRSMESQLDDVYDERQGDTASSSYQDASPLLDDETLAQLDEMTREALNDLSVGVFGLDDQGVVQHVNDAALQWPDVTANRPDALVGQPFFDDVAPAARNSLFQGRLEDHNTDVRLDEPFLYTYVGNESALTNLAVHLHSASDQSTDWIVFTIQEQY